MAAIDVSNLSRKELDELIQRSRKQLRKIKQDETRPALKSSDPRVAEIADRIRDLSKDSRVAKRDVLKAVAGNLRISVGTADRRKAAARYRHPQDPNKTWSGTGARPKWLKEELARGRSLEEFRVSA